MPEESEVAAVDRLLGDVRTACLGLLSACRGPGETILGRARRTGGSGLDRGVDDAGQPL